MQPKGPSVCVEDAVTGMGFDFDYLAGEFQVVEHSLATELLL